MTRTPVEIPASEPAGPVPAGPALWRRLAAILYDLLVVIAILMVLTGLVVLARAGSPFDPRSAWFRLLLVVGWWAYFAWSWTHGGQTLGMRAWRLAVAGRDGAAVSLWQATLRFAAAWLSTAAAGLGFLWVLVDRQRLAWHDRLSGTALVRVTGSAQPEHGERGHEQ